MSQIWAATAAHYYNVALVETYSGGTELSAFNPRAVAALERAGFRVDQASSEPNPLYRVTFCEDGTPLEAFSKVFGDPRNPRSDFCAVMTCSQADRSCPFVPGASARVSIPYEDPKDFDGTNDEAEQYDERCRQISREMLYAFSLLKK
jgi:arsenate reductase